ncbi:hypothetical protein LINPERHAP1_LOCUS35282 [Linum perenne]
MKNYNIFLLFLVIFFVITGNEVATSTRINAGGKCKVGTAGGPPPCNPKACYFQCNLKYGGSVTGQCENDVCNCYNPC